MEPEGSLPHLQHQVTFPYPEQDQSGSYSVISFPLTSIIILSFHLHLDRPSGFIIKIPVCTFLLHTCYMLCPYHFWLYLLIITICKDPHHICISLRLLIPMHVKHPIPYLYIYNRLPEDEPSSSKHAEDIVNKNINSEKIHFVGLYCIIILGNLSDLYFTAL